MSLEEIIEMYEEHTATIFPSGLRTLRSWWPESLTLFKWPFHLPFLNWPLRLPIPIPAYSQDGLEKVLKEKFGDRCLASVRGDERSIAAAVARKQNPPDRPYLDIFDTCRRAFDTGRRGDGGIPVKLNPSIVEVLKASACAPVYFEAPTSIGGVGYIDGGIGGNCPLAQAIPRMRYIAGKDRHLQTVISIAPPREKDTKGKKWWWQWMSWFPEQLTDGFLVYTEQAKENRGCGGKEAMFHRLSPQSEETKVFKLDSWDIRGMKESMR